MTTTPSGTPTPGWLQRDTERASKRAAEMDEMSDNKRIATLQAERDRLREKIETVLWHRYHNRYGGSATYAWPDAKSEKDRSHPLGEAVRWVIGTVDGILPILPARTLEPDADVVERARETELEEKYQEGIHLCMTTLADLIGSKDWFIQDGCEDVDAVVRMTILDVLKHADMYENDQGTFARFGTPAGRPDREAVARIIFDSAVGIEQWDNDFYECEKNGCFDCADKILAIYPAVPSDAGTLSKAAAAVERMKARENETPEEWAENLAPQLVAAGESEYAPFDAEAVREACANVCKKHKDFYDKLRDQNERKSDDYNYYDSQAAIAALCERDIRALPPAPARGEEDDLDPKVIDEIRSRAAVAMKGKTFKSAERIEDALTAVPRTAQGTDEEDLARRAKMHLQYFGVDDHIGMVEMLVGFAEQERKNATSLSPQAGVSEISSAPTNRKILLWWKAAGWGLGFYQDDEEGRGWRCVDDRVIPKNQSDCRFWAELPASPRPASSEAAG